jgi:hypothetical protein
MEPDSLARCELDHNGAILRVTSIEWLEIVH